MRDVYQEVYDATATTAIAGSGDVEVVTIDFYTNNDNERDASLRRAPVNGEATFVLNIKVVSGSGTVNVYAKNIYGNLSDQSYYTLKSGLAVTTTATTDVYKLHIDFTNNYDPNATGFEFKIDFAGAGDDIEYKWRLIRA